MSGCGAISQESTESNWTPSAFPLEQQAAEYIRSGMDPEQARARHTSNSRGGGRERRMPRIAPCAHGGNSSADVRYGLRMLRKSASADHGADPGSGHGRHTTMFSTMDALLIHPLNFPDLKRLVALSEPFRTAFPDRRRSRRRLLDWTSRPASLTVAAYQSWSRI